MSVQAASAVIMVRPSGFAPNPETAVDNAFQQVVDHPTAATAAAEVTAAAAGVEAAGIRVHLFDDHDATRPDSVFPNNWISTHHGGRVALFPMFAPNRRTERRADIVEMLKAEYRVQEVVDYSGLEVDGLYLEGTGAVVLDHEQRLAFVARSRRADAVVLERFCTAFGYEPMAFDAVDDAGVAVYHTNVVLCIAGSFALVGADMIRDVARRAEVIARLGAHGRRVVIDLSEAQIGEFAANAIELCSAAGALLLAMSTRAEASLTADQRAAIERTHRIVALHVPTIELGGGSVRCMLAGIHLDPRVPDLTSAGPRGAGIR